MVVTKSFTLLLVLSIRAGSASAGTVAQNAELYPPPASQSAADVQAWRAGLEAWRAATTKDLRSNFSVYDEPALRWARTSFVQTQVMAHEKLLFNRSSGQYTVDRYLADVHARYGGVDSVLVWYPYPNIGVDDRNQFQLLDSMPGGGVAGVRDMIAGFHREGVRVLLPYNPWDQFTASEGVPDVIALGDRIMATEADGMNGDTMDGVNVSFYAYAAAKGRPMVFQPECPTNGTCTTPQNDEGGLADAAYNVQSYTDITFHPHGQDWPAPAPVVQAYKYLTGGRHLGYVRKRFATDHRDFIQHAFFNGAGYFAWENVWGVFNQLSQRDAEGLRRVAALLRYAGGLVQGSGVWTPHLPAAPQGSHVYTSGFSNATHRLFLLVNTTWKATKGSQAPAQPQSNVLLQVPCNFSGAGPAAWTDLYGGVALDDRATCSSATGEGTVTLAVEDGGVGALLLTSAPRSSGDLHFMARMAAMTRTPLRKLNATWRFLPQRPAAPQNNTLTGGTRPRPGTLSPPDTVLLLATTNYSFKVRGNCIEGDELPYAVDVQFPWEKHPQRQHEKLLTIPALRMHKTPVTKAQYGAFLEASGWAPADGHNWLRDWDWGHRGFTNRPALVPADAKQPVSWVSRADAAAYCAALGMRLPTSYEWQYAAQGMDGRTQPWGAQPAQGRVPLFTTGRRMPPADDVDAHPNGSSPFGVLDMVYNVYQWTDAFEDDHTVRAVIRGGSRWQPQGSSWYQPRPASLNEHNTLLLMSDGMDRSGGIGFRCVVDASSE